MMRSIRGWAQWEARYFAACWRQEFWFWRRRLWQRKCGCAGCAWWCLLQLPLQQCEVGDRRRILLKQFLISTILLAVVVLGVKRVVRFNLLGLFLVLACMALLAGAAELVTQPNAFYRANGYGMLVAMVALLAWPLVAWRQGGNAVPAAN